jgi:hypothetical protein
MEQLSQVIVDDKEKGAAAGKPAATSSPSLRLLRRPSLTFTDPTTIANAKKEEDSDSDEELHHDRTAKDEMEAVQEARQLQQLKSAWTWLMRALTTICIAGTIFLAIKPGRIGIRVGGAQPWRWATMISIFLGSKAVLNWMLDLVMVALDRKHVVVGAVQVESS